MSVYQYVEANPLVKTDPSGEQVKSLPMQHYWAKAAAAYVGEKLEAGWKWLHPDPVPLTTDRLMDIANQLHITAGTTPGSAQENQAVGRSFQDRVLRNLMLAENTRFFQSTQRARRATPDPKTGRVPQWVVPDGVGDALGGFRDPALIEEGEVRARVDSLFVEVKAVKGTITLNHSNWQILGLIDVAANSPASGSRGPGRPFPTIVFVTTSDTEIGRDVLTEATARGVSIWQQTAYTIRDTIQLSAPVNLNPEVYERYGVQGAPWSQAAFGPVGPLYPPSPPVVQDDPDPPEVKK
jgi:hypothetical protein